jgi:predicted HTH transcriptional regulator
MTREELEELIRLGQEAPGLEFKPPSRRDDGRVAAEVTRAALALANRRDGGRIIIGVAEEQEPRRLVPVGLSAEDVGTWNRDEFSSQLARYAEPMIEFGQTTIEIDGRHYLIITVLEFRHSPIICKNTLHHGGKTILRTAALYVRGRRKPESLEVSTYEEMRELIDLAVEKGVQRFAEQLRKAGLIASAPLLPGADEKYDAELRKISDAAR